MNGRSPATSADAAAPAERKLLTLLFADLSGYTRLTATRDPEDVLLAVGPLLAALQEIAEDHGGYVPSVQGDGFLTIFGAPVSHADDPRRAVAAAIAMRDAVAERRKEAADVPDVHIGIASGEVLVTPYTDRHDVIGPAVNLAARLSDAAAPGEVLVDEASAALTADHALYGSARLLDVAGFSGAVRALPLQGVGERAESRPLIGRTEQLERLDDALDRVRASQRSAAALLVGEPGAGKSRLVSAWTAAHPDLLVLRGSSRAYGSPLPLSALSEAIVETTVDDGGSQRTVQDFRALLPRQRSGTSTGREPDEALYVAARKVLTTMSSRSPTVLVLEDLHWADASLLEVLQALNDDPIEGSLLVLATSREPIATLPELNLPPLTPNEVGQVAEQRLGAKPDAALQQLLIDRSAGNPLWLVECLALLSDRGQLGVDGDHVVVRIGAGELELPDTIRLLVSARLDSLSPPQKLILQRASVLPGDIGVGDWPGDVASAAELVDVGLLERVPGDGLRFAHGLIREAVYRSMPRSARAAEHEALLARITDPATRAYAALEVQRLEVSPTDDRKTFIAERALDAVTTHARHLLKSHTRAARDVLLRANDLVGELDVVAPRAAAALLTQLAEVLRDLEDVENSRSAAARATSLAELAADEDTLTRAQLALAEASLGTDNKRARHIAALVLERRVGAPLHGRAWRLMAGSHAYDDMTQLQRHLEEAFRCYDSVGDSDAASAIARQLALNLSVTADAAFDHWLSLATAATGANHLRGQGELALIRAVVAQARGAWEESWLAAESAMSLTERAGMHQSLVDAVAVAVEAATWTGRRNVLPGLLSRLAALMEGRRPRLQITGLCATAPALMLLERAGDAERTLTRAKEMLSSVGPMEASMYWLAQGHASTLAGRHAAAEAAFTAAERLLAELDLSLARLASTLYRLTAQLHQGRHAGLRTELLSLATELDAARATPHAETARALAASLPE